MIRDAIHAAHSRIAKDYGLVKPGQSEPPRPSYDHWNFERSVLRPVTRIVEEFNLAGPGRLLDAGCGNGQFLSIYARLTQKRLVGADFSQTMLDVAAERAAADGYRDRVTLVRTNIEQIIGYGAGTFDVAHCFGVIEHLDDPATVLRELHRVTKPGGTLILGYPRRRTLSSLTFLLFAQSPQHWGETFRWSHFFDYPSKLNHYRFYDPETVYAMAEEAGFRLRTEVPVAPLHMTGLPAKVLYKLASTESGYATLDRVESTLTKLGLPPAGGYLVCERR